MGTPVEKLAGPLLLANLASWGFQGVLCIQVCQYYQAFPNDRLFLKILVYGLFMIEVAQSILLTRDAFDTFVMQFADQRSLTLVRSLWISVTVFPGIVGLIYRLFLIYRLRGLSKSQVVPLLASVLALISAIGALLGANLFSRMKTLSQTKTTTGYIFLGIWYGVGAVCDISITASMVYHLLHQKASFRRTRTRILSLIVVAVETGVLTATTSVLSFILFIVISDGNYFAIPATLILKFYSNSLLLTLNNRIDIIGGRVWYIHSGIQFGTQDLLQWEEPRLTTDNQSGSQKLGDIELQPGFTTGSTNEERSQSDQEGSKIAQLTNISHKQ